MKQKKSSGKSNANPFENDSELKKFHNYEMFKKQ